MLTFFRLNILLSIVLLAACTSPKPSSRGGDSSPNVTNFDVYVDKPQVAGGPGRTMVVSFAANPQILNQSKPVYFYFCKINLSPTCSPLSGHKVALELIGDQLRATADFSQYGVSPGDMIRYTVNYENNSGQGYITGSYLNPKDILKYKVSTQATTDEFGYMIMPGGGFSNAETQFSLSSSLDNSVSEMGVSAAIDSSKDMYILGHTYGSLDESSGGGTDIFVAKLTNPTGVLDTSFGTNGIVQLGAKTFSSGETQKDEVAAEIVMVGGSDIYVVGYTYSDMAGSNCGDSDIFVVKLDSSDGSIETSFGTNGVVQINSNFVDSSLCSDDEVVTAAVQAGGTIYIVGHTYSNLAGTGVGLNAGGYDGFVVALKTDGTLDTNFDPQGSSVSGILLLNNGYVSDASGNDYLTGVSYKASKLYISGYTEGNLFGSTKGGVDAFVVLLDDAVSTLIGFQFSESNLGAGEADGADYAMDILADPASGVYVIGHTTSNFKETNTGGRDAFVSLLDSGTLNLDGSFNGGNGIKLIGSANNDAFVAIAYDSVQDRVFAAGESYGVVDTSGETTQGGQRDFWLASLKPEAVESLDTNFNFDGLYQCGDDYCSSSSDGDELVSDLIVVDDENYLVIGSTNGSLGAPNAGGYDLFTMNFDVSGDPIAAFASSGFYQLGQSVSAFSTDYAVKVFEDAGEIYVVGMTKSSLGESNAGGWDVYVTKLTSAGELDATYGGGDGVAQFGSAGDEIVTGAYSDGTGKIYITGYTDGDFGDTNAGGLDGFILVVDANGNLDPSGFGTTFDGTADGINQVNTTGDDIIHSVVEYSSNLYLVGSTTDAVTGANIGGADLFMMEIDTAGEVVAGFGTSGKLQFGSAQDDLAVEILEQGGDFYILGQTKGSLGNGATADPSGDTFVARVTSAGSVDTTFGGTGYFQLENNLVEEVPTGIAFSSSSYLYIVGNTKGALGEAFGGGTDVFVAKLSVSSASLVTSFGDHTNNNYDGIIQFGSETYPTQSTGKDVVKDILIYNDGGYKIFLTGYTDGNLGGTNGGLNDTFVIQMDTTGSLSSTFGDSDDSPDDGIAQLTGSGSYDQDYGISLFGDSGGLYLAGHTAGSYGDTASGDYDIFAIKIDNSQGTAVSGFGGSDSVFQLGQSAYNKLLLGEEFVVATYYYGTDLYVAGYTLGDLGGVNAGGRDIFVAKVKSDKTLDTTFGGGDGIALLGTDGAGSDDFVEKIFIDASGIYVGGYTLSSLGATQGGNGDIFVARLDSNGDLDATFGGGDGIAQLGSDTDNGAGTTTDLGTNVSQVDRLSDFVVDGGDVYFVGYSNGSFDPDGNNSAQGEYDFIFGKMDSTGALVNFDNDGMQQRGSSKNDRLTGIVAYDGYLYSSGYTSGGGESQAPFNQIVGQGLHDAIIMTADVTDPGNIIMYSPQSLGLNGDSSGDDYATDIAVYGNQIYVAGYTTSDLGETNAGGFDGYVMSFTAFNGTLTLNSSFGNGGIVQFGEETLGAAASKNDIILQVEVDASGTYLYLAGRTFGDLGETNAGDQDSFIIKVATGTGERAMSWAGGDGIAQLGLETVGAAASGADVLTSIEVLSDNSLIVSGFTYGFLGNSGNSEDSDTFIVYIDPTGK